MSAAGLRALVRDRQFGRLYATRLTSQLADGVFQASLASAVFFNPTEETDALKAATGFAVLLLPYSLVGPFAGVLLDRWRRQRVLVLSNLARALMIAVFAAYLTGVGAHGWLFYVGALAIISVNRFVLSGLSAALPHVVEQARLVTANSLSTTSGGVAAIVGGGLALAGRGLVGDDSTGSAQIALVAAGIYVVSAVVASRIPVDLLGPDDDPGRPSTREALGAVVGDMAAGARHLWQHPPAAHALLAIAAHRFFYGLTFLASLLLYRNYFTDGDYLHAGIVGLGEAFAASGVGIVVAAILTPIVTVRVSTTVWTVAAFALAAVVQLGLGLPYRLETFLVAAFLMGFAAQASKICVDTILQESVDDAYRGRVFSFYDVLFNLTFVTAAMVAAVTLPANGKSYVMLVLIAVGYALTALTYGLYGARPVEERATRRPDRLEPTAT